MPSSVLFLLAVAAGMASAGEAPKAPDLPHAVANAPCEREGWVDSRRSSQRVLVRGEISGIAGEGGVTTPVAADVVFVGVDGSRQRAFVAKDGRFKAFALLMREERVSCQSGRYVVERVVKGPPEIEVSASGCAKKVLRLSANESWLDIELQCSVVGRAAQQLAAADTALSGRTMGTLSR